MAAELAVVAPHLDHPASLGTAEGADDSPRCPYPWRVTPGLVLLDEPSWAGSRFVGDRSVELLAQVEAPLIGAVLNDISSEAAYGYGYGAYGYSQTAAPNGRRTRRKTKKAAKRDGAVLDASAPTPEPSAELPLSP